ncbi:MAG TPA: hypothetical protein DDY32_19230 [Desulfobulbaceae bacterium]|nr:hypothetical protein [Desulfobulbaceae bacterium]
MAREYRLPVIAGLHGVRSTLAPGEKVTVDAGRGAVYQGAQELPESRKKIPTTPFSNRLTALLQLISPLHLLDPAAPEFSPQNCGSMHDLVRFAHEKGMAEMFSLIGPSGRKMTGGKRLEGDLPLTMHVLDLGEGLEPAAAAKKVIGPADIASPLMRASWAGLAHPDVAWPEGLAVLDWEEADRLSGGIVGLKSAVFGSYAAVAKEYLHLVLRFGYHFAVLDAYGGDDPEVNYINFRFKGGGGDFENRLFRVRLIERILTWAGFTVTTRGDLLDAGFQRRPLTEILGRLTMLGILQGKCRLLDMALSDTAQVEEMAESLQAIFKDIRTEGRKIFRPTEFAQSSALTNNMNVKSGIYQLDWLTDNLAVGQAPMSYDALDRLRELGIGAILNLCAEFCDLHWIEEKAGFEVWYLPIADEEAPDLQELEKALDWLDECLYLGKKVLVHCRFGIGRTGTVVNAYLLRKGLGHKLAGKKLKGYRSQPANFDQWWFIRKYGKKEKRLTIREPSLESRHLVDLFPFFRDYEKLVDDLDARLERAGRESLCGRDHWQCCSEPVFLSLIEAVYLHHFLNSSRSQKSRQETIARATSSTPHCPLDDTGACILFSQRPTACRLVDLPAEERSAIAADLDAALAKISRDLYFALTSRFAGKTDLVFSLKEVVSGRFVQRFFHHLLQNNRLEAGQPSGQGTD